MITIWKTIFLEKAPVIHSLFFQSVHLTSDGADAFPGSRDFVLCLSFVALCWQTRVPKLVLSS